MSAEAEKVSGLARLLESALGGLAAATHRRPVVALALVAALTAGAVFQARTLKVDPNLAALVPKSFESVKALERLKKRFGGVGYVVIVGQDAEPEVLRRFADDVAPLLEKLETVSYVDHRRPDSFFSDHALYYIEPDDLEAIKERFEERLDWERRKANPLIVDLEDATEPSLDFSDIEKKYSGNRFARAGQRETHYLDADRRLVAIFAKPATLATDLAFVKTFVGGVEQVLAGVDMSKYPGLKVELAGRYKKRVDQQAQAVNDLGKSSLIAVVLVVLYLMFHFRRIGAVVLVMLPLVVGLSWTFGLTATTFGTLNILTTFVGTILLGLGIDHGVHLLERYQYERAVGADSAAAVRIAFTSTGRAVVLAAVTTAVGFAGLSVSEFRAFREFGLIAAAGVLLGVVAYAVCLPPLLSFAARISPKSPNTVGAFGGYLSGLLPKWGPAFFWISTVLSVGIAMQIPNVRFDYDFASLDGFAIRSFALDRTVNEVLGRSQTPIVVLTDSLAEEKSTSAALRGRAKKGGERSTIQMVVSASDLIPPQQDEKHEILEELSEVVADIHPDTVAEADRARFAQLKRMASQTPFTRADLPLQIRRHFRMEGDDPGGMVLIYPAISLSDGERVQELAAEIRAVRAPDGGEISAAGESMILADVLSMIFRESPIAVGVTLVLVFVCLWILLGRLRLAVLAFTPAILTVLCAVGLMHLTGMKLNYVNIVIVPVLFGIGVDAAVHIVVRGTGTLQELVESVREIGRGIWGAVVTTGVGFGALLIAEHPGMNSIGQLALYGLLANLMASLVWLTSLLAMHHIRARRLAEVGLAGSRSARITGDLATVWGAGYSPLGPGTFGAIAALPVGYLLSTIDWVPRAIILAIGTALSFLVAKWYVAGGTEDLDPSEVVLDESIGVLLALAFVPWETPWVIAAFVLFRLFDIWKPGPVGYVDRKMKNYVGIMLDDVLAGLMAGALLLAIRMFALSS